MSSRRLPHAWASPEVLDQILLLGQAAAPNEACGIITPDLRVVSLPNVTPTNAESSYAIQSEDLVEAISHYIARAKVDETEVQRAQFMIWHTHPSGYIGPSRGDLDNRASGFQYVVVALPNGEATIF